MKIEAQKSYYLRRAVSVLGGGRFWQIEVPPNISDIRKLARRLKNLKTEYWKELGERLNDALKAKDYDGVLGLFDQAQEIELSGGLTFELFERAEKAAKSLFARKLIESAENPCVGSDGGAFTRFCDATKGRKIDVSQFLQDSQLRKVFDLRLTTYARELTLERLLDAPSLSFSNLIKLLRALAIPLAGGGEIAKASAILDNSSQPETDLRSIKKHIYLKPSWLAMGITALFLLLLDGDVNKRDETSGQDLPAAASPAEETTDQTDYSTLSLSTLFQQATKAAIFEKDYQKAISQLEAVIERCPSSDLSVIAHLRIGYIYAQYLEDYTKAIGFYQKVADSRPRTPWAAHALFEIANIKIFKMKKYQEGIQIYEQVVQNYPDRKEWIAAAWLSIGETYFFHMQDGERANEYFEKVIILLPDSEFARIAKYNKEAGIEEFKRRCDSGIIFQYHWYCRQRFEAVLSATPQDKRIEWEKRIAYSDATHYYEYGEFEKSAESFQKYFRIPGNLGLNFDIHAQSQAGMNFGYLGEFDKALQYLLKARGSIDRHLVDKPEVILGQDVWGYEYYYPALMSQVEYEIGNIYLRVLGDKGQALSYFEQAESRINKMLKDKNSYGLAIITLLKIADAYAYDIKNYAGEDYLKRAEDIYKNIKQNRLISVNMKRLAFLALGNLFYQMGDVDSAQGVFREVIRINPNGKYAQRARLAMGRIYFENGDLEKAQRSWAEVKANRPERYVAAMLQNIYQPNSPYRSIERGQFNNEIGYEIFENQLDKNRIILISLHGIPETYIPGKVTMTNGILTAEYEHGFSVSFYDPTFNLFNNNSVLEGIEKIPPGIFNGSPLIIFLPEVGGDLVSGRYIDKPAVLIAPSAGVGTLLHELIHFYDLASTGMWFDPLDSSTLFRRISYFQSGSHYWERRYDYHDLFGGFGTFAVNILSLEGDKPSEDLAYHSADYFEKGSTFRKQARRLMERGKFELAAKYLFIRYLTPFDGREYDLSNRNPSLGFEEVERAIAKVRSEHPERINLSVVDIIQEIKERWQNEQTELACQDTVEW